MLSHKKTMLIIITITTGTSKIIIGMKTEDMRAGMTTIDVEYFLVESDTFGIERKYHIDLSSVIHA